jgi:hypothetical protein
MFNHIIQNERIKFLDERKDARKKLNEIQPIVAVCKTKDCEFKASIDDVSSSGVFINTRRHLSTGQEIAMKFSFPKAKNTIMATGEIVRASGKGVGVKFKFFFKDKNHQPDIFELAWPLFRLYGPGLWVNSRRNNFLLA